MFKMQQRLRPFWVLLVLAICSLAGTSSIASEDIPPQDQYVGLSMDEYFYLFPVMPEPELSADGNALYNATPPIIYLADPNPPEEMNDSQADQPKSKSNILQPAGSNAIKSGRLDQSEAGSAAATFNIQYIANGGTDLWGQVCQTFPESAKPPFNAAAAIWSSILQSNVPITIKACWANLGGSSILGYSGGGSIHRNFTNAPLASTWYSASLANSLTGSDLDPSNQDMHITYNSNFTWYYGTDGNPPSNQHDLMTVVLHEIGHGLNFAGSMTYSGGIGSWGYRASPTNPNIYDTFMKDGAGVNLTSYSSGSTALGSQLVSNNIWFHGANAMTANGGSRVKMYAPSTWAPGSSYSHLDYATFNNTINQLMVYAISAGEAVHDPGPVTKGLFTDWGWVLGGSPTYSKFGVFRSGIWYLDLNGNSAWDGCSTDGCISGWGIAGDLPVVGDWGNTGVAKFGVFRNGIWYLDLNGNRVWDGCSTDGCISGWGIAGDLPVVGDWGNTGVAKFGVFRNGTWYLDLNGNSAWDGCSTDGCITGWGIAGDLPVVGDWGNTGVAKFGVFRNGTWYLDLNGNSAWDGCSTDGCITGWGIAGDLPVVGDWGNTGVAKFGVFRNGTWYLDLNGNSAWDGCSTDGCITGWGIAGDLPVVGNWGQ